MRAQFLCLLLSTSLTIPSAAGSAHAAALRQNEPHSYAATRVLVGPCLFKEGSGELAIPAALLTFGIKKAINVVGTALRRAGEDKSVSFTGNGNFDQPADKLNDTCTIVIRGRFRSSVTQADIKQLKDSPPSWATDMKLTGAMLDTLAQHHRAVLAEAPDFMFEGVFNQSQDKTAFTMRPLYVRMNRPLERPSLDPRSGRRHTALLFALVPPGESIDAASNPGAEIVLGELSPKKTVRFQFEAPAEQPVTDSEEGEETVVALPYIAWPQESRWFALDANTIKGPMTMRVVVTETRKGSALAKFIADAFDTVKEDLGTEAGNLLIPSQRREAAAAEATADDKLRTDYVTALQAALTALDTCGGADKISSDFASQSKRLEVSQIAYSKQVAANNAARAAGSALPFSDEVMIQYSAAKSVVDKCTSARNTALETIGGAEESDDT